MKYQNLSLDFIGDDEVESAIRNTANQIQNLGYHLTVSKFHTPFEMDILKDIARQMDWEMVVYGGCEQAERLALVMSRFPFDWESERDKHFTVLQLEDPDGDFSHRDLLGAIMHFGVDRGAVGDIIFRDGLWEVLMTSEVAEQIYYYQKKIANRKVHWKKKEHAILQEPKIEKEGMDVFIASLRLDAFLQQSLHLSRANAQDLIRKERVKVNYHRVTDVSYAVEEGDLFSVRGFGRYEMKEIVNRTKKDRYHVLVLKWRT